MTQSKTPPNSEQSNEVIGKFQSQISSGISLLETEGRKFLNNLGADLDNEDRSLTAIITRLRQKNPTLKQFTLNLDTSTYDLREKASWNLHMMSAYARIQAEKAYQRDLRPRIVAVIERLDAGFKKLSERPKRDSHEETEQE
ncbi:hypothetical protein [Hahella ganghwensis]|uniref:hypothetical protein n=1 Tax=Hahella ganghwensis TaxID=286420 RepID=UPI00036ADADD|nr:hypothetical protein [Hahella ganghwensis]